MADISMCVGENCKLREKCIRYTSKKNGIYQSYLEMTPYDKKSMDCDFFWSNKVYKDKKWEKE